MFTQAMQSKKIFTKQDILCVIAAKITLSKAQIIDSIQHICFADAIVPNYAVYLFGENKIPLWVVFEIKKCKFS